MTANYQNSQPVRRAEWNRPEVRQIKAGAAEVGAGATPDGPVFS